MATIEQEQTQRKQLAETLSKLNDIKPEALARDDELGRALGFSKGIPFFRRTLALFRSLSEANLDTVPFSRLQRVSGSAAQALSLFDQIRSFSLEQNPQNPSASRDGLINQVRDSYDSAFEEVSPLLAYAIRKGTDFERLEESARSIVGGMNALAEEQRTVYATQTTEIESILEKARRAAEEAGVAQHATHFKREAEEHANSARFWLCWTGFLGIVTIAFGIAALVAYYKVLPGLTPAQSIQLAVLKIVVFSVLFTAILAGGRIYRAHRHNYVVNKHRQNALSTFEAFAKAASDEPTKNAVLLQATQCIFSPQPTGYVQAESDSGPSMNVWELVGGIANGSKRP